MSASHCQSEAGCLFLTIGGEVTRVPRDRRLMRLLVRLLAFIQCTANLAEFCWVFRVQSIIRQQHSTDRSYCMYREHLGWYHVVGEFHPRCDKATVVYLCPFVAL